MSHRSHRSLRSGSYGRLFLTTAAVFIAAYLLLSNASGRTVSISHEAQFTDQSPSGMQVVPASGGTVTGTYTGAYTGTYTAAYPPPTCDSADPTCRQCPNGLNMLLYPTCVCPAGQVQSGNGCIVPTPSTGTYTVSYPTGTGAYNPGTGAYTGSYAPNSCWDGSDPDPLTGACPACPPEYTRVGNSCVPTDSNPHFIGFPTSRGFNASGHLEVRPGLVRSGDRTYVYWNVSNVRDCTVRGSNGDGAPGSLTGTWNSLGSGPAGMTTSPITSRTSYTLFCRSLIGATPSTITETRSVNVIPSWYEPQGPQ